MFFQAPNAPKLFFGWGEPRIPLRELTTLPQTPTDPLVGRGG